MYTEYRTRKKERQKKNQYNKDVLFLFWFGVLYALFAAASSSVTLFLRTRLSFDRLWRNLLAPPLSLLQVLLLTLALLLRLPPLPVLRLIRDLAPDPFRAAIQVVPEVAVPFLRGERGQGLLPSSP